MTKKEIWEKVCQNEKVQKAFNRTAKFVKISIPDPDILSDIIAGILNINRDSIIDTVFIHDRMTNKSHLLTTFKLSDIMVEKKIGASTTMDFPIIEKLKGFLYPEKASIYDYSLDRNEIIFRWHNNMATCCMANISMTAVDSYEYAKVQDREDKGRIMPTLASIYVEVDEDGTIPPYNPDEYDEGIEKIRMLKLTKMRGYR